MHNFQLLNNFLCGIRTQVFMGQFWWSLHILVASTDTDVQYPHTNTLLIKLPLQQQK